MKTDTTDFLSTLLWLAADNEDETGRALTHKTIHDFAPAFVAGAEAFIDAFRAYLEATGCGHLADAGTRSFGGNVYLSLSGHGAGFFDDCDEEIAALHETITKWAGGLRFEELGYSLTFGEDGKIDIAVLPEYVDKARARMFAVPQTEETKEEVTK